MAPDLRVVHQHRAVAGARHHERLGVRPRCVISSSVSASSRSECSPRITSTGPVHRVPEGAQVDVGRAARALKFSRDARVVAEAPLALLVLLRRRACARWRHCSSVSCAEGAHRADRRLERLERVERRVRAEVLADALERGLRDHRSPRRSSRACAPASPAGPRGSCRGCRPSRCRPSRPSRRRACAISAVRSLQYTGIVVVGRDRAASRCGRGPTMSGQTTR